jgi:hypothetical protein
VCVQAFRPELAIERFDKGIVDGLARAGEVQGDTTLVGPEIEVARNELSPLINPDCLGEPELPADVFEDLDNISPAEVKARDRRREDVRWRTYNRYVERYDAYEECL